MPAQKEIKIGAIVATKGPAALLGNSFVKALHLAKEELQGTKHSYALLVEEILSPEQTETAINKLIDVDKVQALIVGFSVSGKLVRPYATAAKIPLFCICSVRDIGDELYTFTTMPLAEDEATMWVAEAKRRGVKQIAALTQSYPSIDNHVRALKASAGPEGMTFVCEKKFEDGTTDFRSLIEAAQKTSPDLYFVEAFNPALDILGRQLGEAGVRNMASVVAFSASDEPELFEGGWYTDSYVSPAFKARLDRRFADSRIATHMMPYAYDSFRMLVDAFESGEDVLNYIRQLTSYQGTAGVITKEAGTGNFRSSPAVWIILGGKPVLAEPMDRT